MEIHNSRPKSWDILSRVTKQTTEITPQPTMKRNWMSDWEDRQR